MFIIFIFCIILTLFSYSWVLCLKNWELYFNAVSIMVSFNCWNHLKEWIETSPSRNIDQCPANSQWWDTPSYGNSRTIYYARSMNELTNLKSYLVQCELVFFRWRYCITSILEENVRRRVKMWSWESIKKHRWTSFWIVWCIPLWILVSFKAPIQYGFLTRALT